MRKELSSVLLTSKLSHLQSRDAFDFSALENDAEIKEITLQLVMIRKAYDHVVSQNCQKREQIDLMKKQIAKLETTTETCTDDQTSISSRIKQLTKELEVYRAGLEKENQDNKILEHILNRTKSNVIELELKSNHLHSSLNTLRSHLNEYEKKSRKNKEEHVKSQRLLRNVSENLKIEKKNNEDLIRRLEKAADHKKQASERRQQRIIKQAEIAEIAANQNRNAEEIALKEQIYLYKIFWMFLNYKQEKAFRESEDAEEAFKRIRVATGLSNIQTVVEGFLKRDELSEELQKSISEQDKQLLAMKKKSEKVRAELNSVLLISKESSSPYYLQLKELNEQIEAERKSYKKSLEASQVYDHLNADLEDIFKKIKMNLISSPSPSNEDVLSTLKALCEEISASKEETQVEISKAESEHISSLLKNINQVGDSHTRRELSMQEDNMLSLEDNN